MFTVDNSNPLFLGVDFSGYGGNTDGVTGLQVSDIGVVPEPTSLGVIALGAMGMLGRRRGGRRSK